MEIDPLATGININGNTKGGKIQLTSDQSRLVKEALNAWIERDSYVEEIKNEYVIAYFWVLYNNETRDFNSTQKLKALLAETGDNVPPGY